MTRSVVRYGIAARYALGVAVALAASAAIFAQQQAPAPQSPQQPTFKTATNLVHVDVYPRKGGHVVDGLTPADFEIFEDGKPQKVETFQFVQVQPGLPDNEQRDPNNQREELRLAADPANRVFVVYLDTFHVSVSDSHRTREPLVNMLDRLLAPNDLFGVLTPAQSASELALGRKVLTTSEVLAKYWSWGVRESQIRFPEEQALIDCFGRDPKTGQQIVVPDGATMRWIADVLVDRRREDLVLTKLEELVRYLAEIREERKSLIVFTQGWLLFGPDQTLVTAVADHFGPPSAPAITYNGTISTTSKVNGTSTTFCGAELSRLAALDDQRRLRDLIDLANRSNVTFYPVNPGGLLVFDRDMTQMVMPNPGAPTNATAIGDDMDRIESRTDTLINLARNTDGIAVVNSNDLSAGLNKIVDALQAYYLLGYYSTNTKADGAYRKIEVKVKQPGVAVSARHGYKAPSAAEMASRSAPRPSEADVALAAEVSAALSPLARIGSDREVFTSGVVRGQELLLTVELGVPTVSGGHWATGANVQAVVTRKTGEAVGTVEGRIDAGARGTLLRLPLADASTGPWHVAVHLRSETEALVETADVSASASTLLGAPIIYRGTHAGLQLRPAGDFSFRRTERAHFEWAIGVPLEARQGRLLDRTGRALPISVTLSERTDGGRTLLVADVDLAPLGPGDYIVEVTASGGGSSDRQLIAIRVGQ